jgi:hypothetical protein
MRRELHVMAEAKSNPVQPVFTPTRGVQTFFGGVSRMWVNRRRRYDPRFPKPVFFGSDRPLWRIADLEKYAAGAPTTPEAGVVP